MRVHFQRCADVGVSHLLLQYRNRCVFVGEFGSKPVPECVKPRILFGDAEFPQHRFQPIPHDVVPSHWHRAFAIRKQQPSGVVPPSLLQVVLEHSCQRRRHGKQSRRRFRLGLPDAPVVVVRAFVDGDGLGPKFKSPTSNASNSPARRPEHHASVNIVWYGSFAASMM